MEKILLAIDHSVAEQKIKEALESDKDQQIVGVVDNQSSILDFFRSKNVDILVFREGISGEDDDIQFIILLKRLYPSTRIVFMTGEHQVGDKELGKLVAFQIYDILVGEEIALQDLIDSIRTPKTFADALYLFPYGTSEDGVFTEEELRQIREGKQPMSLVERAAAKSKSANEAGEKPKPASAEKTVIIVEGPTKEVLPKKKTTSETAAADKNNEGLLIDLRDANKRIKKLEAENAKMHEAKKQAEKEAFAAKDEVAMLQNQMKEEQRKFQEEINEMVSKGKSNMMQRIVMFYGSRPGVGTSTIALNCAAIQALQGKKVCYIELDERFPSVACWLSFDGMKEGLEKCLNGIESRTYQDINRNIITKAKILSDKDNKDMHNFQEQLPDGLHYLTFSSRYLIGEHPDISPMTVKELLLTLLYKEGYDYIMLDLGAGYEYALLEMTAIFSTTNVFVMSQDIASIIDMRKRLQSLASSGLNFEFFQETEETKQRMLGSVENYKNYYVINRFNEKQKLNKNTVNEWFPDCKEKIFFVPDNSLDIGNAVFSACIPIQKTKDRNYLLSLKRLANIV